MLRIIIQQTKNCAVKFATQPTRQYAQHHRYRPNAGVRRQSKAGTNETELESSQWDDDLSKYEGDLSNTSEIYEQYKQETRDERDNVRHNIVRSKYFNEKKLSFLTWAEMEQIRLLHATDPEEWDDEKLAESFPADALTIKKILKGNWQPRNEKRIVKHDEKVRLNWQSFVNGEMNDMDPRFSEHLRKFSTRNLNQKVDYGSVMKKEMPKPKSTEFLSIITSCKKYKEEPKQIPSDDSLQEKNQLTERPKKGTSQSERKDSQKLYAFKPSNSDTETAVSSNAAIVFDNPSGTGTKKSIAHNEESLTVNPFAISKYDNNEVQLDQQDMKQLSVASIRHHIEIPAKLFKEGATYRLDDCYYDDDGEFLYRVPGMTKV